MVLEEMKTSCRGFSSDQRADREYSNEILSLYYVCNINAYNIANSSYVVQVPSNRIARIECMLDNKGIKPCNSSRPIDTRLEEKLDLT